MGALQRVRWVWGFALVACSGASQQAESPSASSGNEAYPGKCWLVGIDEVEAPTNTDPDSIALVARYRFGSAPESSKESRVSLQFQIARARKNDLKRHLEANSNVVCTPPKRVAEEGEKGAVQVPPFEGQQGQPVP